MVQESGVDEGDIVPCTIVGQPDVGLEELDADVLQEFLFSPDEVPSPIIV